MTRAKTYLSATVLVASILGTVPPTLAQVPAPIPAPVMEPAPTIQPAPVMTPESALAPAMAPGPESYQPRAASSSAPRAPDDMTGSIGLGVGIIPGTDSLIKPDTSNLMMPYWMSDTLMLVPRLALGLSKATSASSIWNFTPSLLANYVMLKGASTRLLTGIGFGFGLAKDPSNLMVEGADKNKIQLQVFIPVDIGVQHFFTRWFAMGISATFRLVDFRQQGAQSKVDLAINNTQYMGTLFIYTD